MASALEKLKQQNAAKAGVQPPAKPVKQAEVHRGSVQPAKKAAKRIVEDDELPEEKFPDIKLKDSGAKSARVPTEADDDEIMIEVATVEEIKKMKTRELDELNAELPESLDGWEKLDRAGKVEALIEALHGGDPEEVDADDEEEETESEEETDDEEVEETEDDEDAEETGEEDDTAEVDDVDAELDDDKEEAPAPKSRKGKTAPAKDVKLDPNDMIVKVSSELEKLTEEQADAEMAKISDDIEYNYFRLGGVLSVIKRNKYIGEHKTFRDKVEAEFGMKYRKAEYLVTIYNNIVESGVSWEQVKNIGWSKMKHLSHILTPENVEEWVEKAEEMNVGTLQNEVRAFERGDDDAEETSTATKPTTNAVSALSFKVHEDQKENISEAIDKAMEEMGTESKAQALEHICLDYLAGGKKKVVTKELTLEQTFAKILKDAKGADDEEKTMNALSTLLEGPEFKKVFGVAIGEVDFSAE